MSGSFALLATRHSPLATARLIQDVTGGVPELVGEVAAGGEALFGQKQVLSDRGGRYQRIAQRIRAVFLDDVQWINDIA